MADYWYVQQGFRELAQHFSNRDAHIPSVDDPKNVYVTTEELFRALPSLPKPAAAVAQALLAEPRDAYVATSELQQESWFGDRPTVSLRDLFAAARGRGYANEDLGERATTLYTRVQKQLDNQRALASAREVSTIVDPVWRELARGVDNAGNRDGWLSDDPNGFIEKGEMARTVAAVSAHERIPGLRARDLFDAYSPRHNGPAELIDAHRKAVASKPDRSTPLTRIPIDLLTSPTVRGYARELSGNAQTFPLTYDDRGKPSGALATLVAAVEARDGAFPAEDAWLTDRTRLTRDGGAIEATLRALPPAELFDFTSQGIFANAYARDGVLTPENAASRPRSFGQVDVLRDGTVRPMRDLVVDIYRARFPDNIKRLAGAIREAGLDGVPVAHIVAMADNFYRRQQDAGTVGAVYEAHTRLGAQAYEGFHPLTLTAPQQRHLEGFFGAGTPTVAQLTSVERESVTSGRLTLNEVAELRAVRAATKYFEQRTVLKDDYGGWTGNWLSETEIFDVDWMPETLRNLTYGQTNCLQEAHTYVLFLQQLEARGLLRHFAPSGLILKSSRTLGSESSRLDTAHAGVLLTRRNNGDAYVVDSWVDGGGTPAHVVRVHDWLAGEYRASVVAPPSVEKRAPTLNRRTLSR